jgi:hypothetical protein
LAYSEKKRENRYVNDLRRFGYGPSLVSTVQPPPDIAGEVTVPLWGMARSSPELAAARKPPVPRLVRPRRPEPTFGRFNPAQMI